MKQLEIENQLRDVVSRIIVQVELATAQGRTDINLALEDAFIPILRSAYNLPQLYNLNRKQKNYPGIDLGDDFDRVSFQVTATTSLEKVKETLRQFMERKYYNSFDELYVLTLIKKQSSYSQKSVDEVLNEHFSFNTKRHVIDLSDVLAKVAGLRIAAQERVLTEFKRILGEVDAFNSYTSEGMPDPQKITTNLQEIELPEHIYVAEVVIDEDAVFERAKEELGYKRKVSSKAGAIRTALRLEGENNAAWVYFDGKIFSFRDIEGTALENYVDAGSVERLETEDLATSDISDNVNIVKQLLVAETQERLKPKNVRFHTKDRFFYFSPLNEGDQIRKEKWVGLRKTERTVYEVKYQKKDPTKTLHHRHFSFELSFVILAGTWYAQIVPNWYYSHDGYKRSFWHKEFLSKQKRLELNQSVRNFVRFTAYFLSHLDEVEGCALNYKSLVVFNTEENDETRDDASDDDLDQQGEAA